MAFPGISRALDRSEHFRDAIAAAPVDADISVVDGLDAPLLSALVRRRRDSGKPPVLLVIAPTGRRVESLMPALSALLPEAAVLPFPAWETLPHERLSPSPETVGRRLETLARIASSSGPAPVIIVASVRAALQPLAAGLADVEPVRLRAGERGHDLGVIVERLVEQADDDQREDEADLGDVEQAHAAPELGFELVLERLGDDLVVVVRIGEDEGIVGVVEEHAACGHQVAQNITRPDVEDVDPLRGERLEVLRLERSILGVDGSGVGQQNPCHRAREK